MEYDGDFLSKNVLVTSFSLSSDFPVKFAAHFFADTSLTHLKSCLPCIEP